MSSLMSGLNAAYHVRDSRRWYKARAIAVALTLGISILVIAALFIVVAGGSVAELVGSKLNLANITVIAWKVVQWPVALAFIILAFALSMMGLALTLKASLPVVILGLALLSSGTFVFQASTTMHLGMVAGRARSSAAGLYVTFYYIGGSVGAVLPATFWVRGGWPATVALLACASVLAVALGFAASRKEAQGAHAHAPVVTAS
jgi:uncharacterized BrkB/YihY/UPF0761 family membrane protein